MALEFKVALPDNLAREAEATGLLTSEAIADLLRSEIRRRQADQLFKVADGLAAQNVPPLTEAELEAEIAAARAARRQADARGR